MSQTITAEEQDGLTIGKAAIELIKRQGVDAVVGGKKLRIVELGPFVITYSNQFGPSPRLMIARNIMTAEAHKLFDVESRDDGFLHATVFERGAWEGEFTALAKKELGAVLNDTRH